MQHRSISVPQGPVYTNGPPPGLVIGPQGCFYLSFCGTKRYILDPNYYQGYESCTLEGTTPITPHCTPNGTILFIFWECRSKYHGNDFLWVMLSKLYFTSSDLTAGSSPNSAFRHCFASMVLVARAVKRLQNFQDFRIDSWFVHICFSGGRWTERVPPLWDCRVFGFMSHCGDHLVETAWRRRLTQLFWKHHLGWNDLSFIYIA